MYSLRQPAPVLLSLVLCIATPLVAQTGHASPTVWPPAPIKPLPHGEGARRMAERIRAIFAAYDWKAEPNKQAERIPYYQNLLKHNLNLGDEVTVRVELGNEQLRAGFSADAVENLETLLKDIRPYEPQIPRNILTKVHMEMALAYLRLGEQENCIGMHNPYMCVFPLSAPARHTKTRGAEGAIREYTHVLTDLDPTSNLAIWLMNIAYQQLGRYPQDVPKKWLADPKLFDSEYDIGYFPEVAALAGVNVFGRSGGAIVEDFDGDGLLDIVVSSSTPLDHMHFFHNNGDGTFTDRTKEAGLEDELGGLNLILTDYNNDGHPDILVLRGAWWGGFGEYPLSLLRNNGDGTFDDVTEEAGLLTAGPTQAAAWADYDNDGWLDLFVGHESGEHYNNYALAGGDHPSLLFHNNHNGTFTMVTPPGADSHGEGRTPNDNHPLGSNLGYVKGAAWGDFNNDGRIDLYLSTMFGPSFLFRNDGPKDPAHPETGEWKWTEVTEQAGLGGDRYTFPTWFFDYDNDGWLDLFAGGYSTTSMEDVGRFELDKPHKASVSHLWRNNHDGTFTEQPHALGLDRAITTMAANFGDLDNDGWLDVYLTGGEPDYACLVPKRMFRNDEGRHFQDVTTAGGFGNLQKGHGVVFADIENSGNEDIFQKLGGAYPGDGFYSVLYHNPGHGNHSITLVLQGVKTNRAAYGARITVTINEIGPDGKIKPRRIYRAVGSVSSFGANPMRQHIGIGKATQVKDVEIWWPTSNTRQHFTNLPADTAWHITEFNPVPEQIHWKQFEIGREKIAPPLPMPDMPGMNMH